MLMRSHIDSLSNSKGQINYRKPLEATHEDDEKILY